MEVESESATAPDQQTAFLQAVKAPISGDRPAGEKILYDDDFLKLKTHIDNIGSASGQADYEAIIELSRRILTEKSKDLRAAAYLVIGEARQNGAHGAAEALHAVWLLINKHWEHLYPPKSRMKGRGGALQFIPDRLSDWLSASDFVKDDREALNAVREDLNSIQDFALAEMGEHAPAFSGLMKALDKILRTLPDPKPSSADDGATTSQPAQEFGPATGSSSNDSGDKVADTENAETEPTGGSGAPTSEDTEIHSDVEATRAVRTAATYFRDQDLTNPIPYRLIRIVRWGQLREEPANDGGTTRLEAPREQRRSYLESLLHEGEYETLVQEAESSFQWETYHFWLDLQRLLASALNALGDPYQSAHDAVLMETALLIRRIPRLPRLTFQEGSPFAGPLTQDWIKTEVEAHPENGGASGSGAGQETERAANKDYREARQHLANGDLEEAVSIMRAGSSEDTSQKDVFHRRLYTAILCLNGNHPAVARPILDALDASIEEYGLDTWNPSLALEVWSCRCRCYTMLAEQATKERRQACLDHAEAAFEKICRMDAEEALSIDRPPLR